MLPFCYFRNVFNTHNVFKFKFLYRFYWNFLIESNPKTLLLKQLNLTTNKNLFKMENKEYTSPSIEIIEVEVEAGFAASNGEFDNEDWE